MIQSSGGYIAHALGDVMRGTFSKTAPETPPAAQSQEKKSEFETTAQRAPFDAELKTQLAATVGASPEAIQIRELTSPDTGRSSSTRQFIVTLEAPPSGPFPVLMPGNNFRGIEMVPDAKDFNFDPIAITKDRLSKLGVDTSLFQFSRWDDVINNVGGSRTFHYMRVMLPNGTVSDHSVEWTLQNPNVTAAELQTLLREQRVMS